MHYLYELPTHSPGKQKGGGHSGETLLPVRPQQPHTLTALIGMGLIPYRDFVTR